METVKLCDKTSLDGKCVCSLAAGHTGTDCYCRKCGHFFIGLAREYTPDAQHQGVNWPEANSPW